jgi:hypothetical protein
MVRQGKKLLPHKSIACRKGLHGLHGARGHLASTKKAPGPPGGIANEMLRFCNDEIASHLADIPCTCFEVGYRLKSFRRTVTVVLAAKKGEAQILCRWKLQKTENSRDNDSKTYAPHHAIQFPLTDTIAFYPREKSHTPILRIDN